MTTEENFQSDSMISDGNPPLDTRIRLITPENISFEYQIAGPFQRAVAYGVDLVLRLAFLFFLFSFVSLGFLLLGVAGLDLSGITVGFYLVVIFVMEWIYGILLEAYWHGQTPGKKLLRLRVLTVDGQPINLFQAILRNLLRAGDMLPLFPLISLVGQNISLPLSLVGLAACTLNRRFQRLGDLTAGTMVVVEHPQQHFDIVNPREPEVQALAQKIPKGFTPTRGLARVLSTYVQRRTGFSWQRRFEMAYHLAEPLRVTFNFPREVNPDLLLCALYYHLFLLDAGRDEQTLDDFVLSNPIPAPVEVNPFGQVSPVVGGTVSSPGSSPIPFSLEKEKGNLS